MSDWSRDVTDGETIVRGICSPYHVSSSGRLKPEAFNPTPNTDEVSVMRHDWIGTEACRDRAKALEDPTKGKIYRGMAALSAGKIRKTGAEVVDSREYFDGHADIKLGYVVTLGEPPPADILPVLRERKKSLAKAAVYFVDPDPAAPKWSGTLITPSTPQAI